MSEQHNEGSYRGRAGYRLIKPSAFPELERAMNELNKLDYTDEDIVRGHLITLDKVIVSIIAALYRVGAIEDLRDILQSNPDAVSKIFGQNESVGHLFRAQTSTLERLQILLRVSHGITLPPGQEWTDNTMEMDDEGNVWRKP